MATWKELIFSGSNAKVASLDILSSPSTLISLEVEGNIEFPNLPVQPTSDSWDLPEGTLRKQNTEIDGGWNIMVANADPEAVGCMDSTATNYDPLATIACNDCCYSPEIINLPTNPIGGIGDPDNDGSTTTADLLLFLSAFGTGHTDGADWASNMDWNGDGFAATADLLLLLGAFGSTVEKKDSRPTITWTGANTPPWWELGDQLIPDPTFTSGITGWVSIVARGTVEYDSSSELLRLLPSGLVSTGVILEYPDLLTPGSSHKVVFKARGEKANGTAQGSAFTSIGDMGDLGTVVANPPLALAWQDYEFHITPDLAALKLYPDSTEGGDIIEFDDIYVYINNHVTSASVNAYYQSLGTDSASFWTTLPSSMMSYDPSTPDLSNNVKAYIEQTGYSASIELFTYLYFDQTTVDNSSYIPGYTITGGSDTYTTGSISGSYP